MPNDEKLMSESSNDIVDELIKLQDAFRWFSPDGFGAGSSRAYQTLGWAASEIKLLRQRIEKLERVR